MSCYYDEANDKASDEADCNNKTNDDAHSNSEAIFVTPGAAGDDNDEAPPEDDDDGLKTTSVASSTTSFESTAARSPATGTAAIRATTTADGAADAPPRQTLLNGGMLGSERMEAAINDYFDGRGTFSLDDSKDKGKGWSVLRGGKRVFLGADLRVPRRLRRAAAQVPQDQSLLVGAGAPEFWDRGGGGPRGRWDVRVDPRGRGEEGRPDHEHGPGRGAVLPVRTGFRGLPTSRTRQCHQQEKRKVPIAGSNAQPRPERDDGVPRVSRFNSAHRQDAPE